MQELDLHLSHLLFYCPVTGKQILFEDDYIPSPATMYTNLQDHSCFQFVHESLMPLIDKLGLSTEHTDLDQYDEFKKTLKKQTNFVLFSVSNGGGPCLTISDHCIDMDYRVGE